jgi:hypothetical protein
MTHGKALGLAAVGFLAVGLLAVSVLLAEEPAESPRASRQLSDAYRESFGPPAVADQQLENELQDLIDKVNAISLPETVAKPRPRTAPQRPDRNAAPKIPDGVTAVPRVEEAKATVDAPEPLGPPEQLPVPPTVLQALTEQSHDAIADPLRLADAHYAEAATFYERQLERVETPADKAWLVYQMANCKADSDRPKAMQLYRRVMAEFGDSPWAALAKTNLELLQWMDANQPREFLRELTNELQVIAKE